MKTHFRNIALVLALGLIVPVASGWGPQTELAIVNTAVQLISQEGEIPLRRLARHVQQGASMTDDELERFYPTYQSAPIEAIESQIDLLKTVRGQQIDPYFAYRLGVLGKLVATVTAPMFTANPTYRQQYYADVDQNIERTNLTPSTRQMVEPATYFGRIMSEAAQQESILEGDYAAGLGFKGVGQTALSQDASRSVRAVADVWYTILTSPSAAGAISDRQVRSYVLGAVTYFVERGNLAEINAAYERLEALGVGDEALYQQIGNIFFDAEMYERAIAEYQRVLATNPANREVADRMAEYYARMGEQELEDGKLEQAKEYFTLATETNKLHPTAQQSLFQVEKLLAERNARMAEQEAALKLAEQRVMEAERFAAERKFALAVTTLNEARTGFASVSDEFPQIAQQANLGLKDVQARLNTLQEDLIGNAQTLSGSGFLAEAQSMAARAESLSGQGLRTIAESELKTELDTLRKEYDEEIQKP